MAFTQEEVATVRRFLAEKQARRKAALNERLLRARKDAGAIIRMIVQDYGPARIYQWGSLVDGRGFSELSDIDIALEGITDPAAYFALFGDAEKLTDFPLDIVQLETIHPVHAAAIRGRGRLVYERS